MNYLRKTICVLLLISPVLCAAPPQSATTKAVWGDQQSTSVAQKDRPFDPKAMILSVLHQQLEAQKSFADESLRVAIQATIADMLWGFDEPRARRLLEEAFFAITNVKEDGQGKIVRLSYVARSIVIRTLATRDQAMAVRLQQSVEIPTDIDPKLTGIGMAVGLYAERARIQNELAMYILMGESRTGGRGGTLQAMKPFADRGDFQRLIPFIRQIRTKDATAADMIFSQALAKARLGKPSFDDIRHLSSYVFPNFGNGVFRYADKKVDPFEATPISRELLDEFLDLAYTVVARRLDAALDNVEDARLDPRSVLDYAFPKTLVPYLDRFMPERAAALQARLVEVTRLVSPEEQPYLALSEPGFEGLVSIADKLTDSRAKDTLYQNAASRAKYTGDLNRAAVIIAKISNEIFRSSQREELRREADSHNYEATFKAFEAKDLEKAEELVADISDQRQRLVLFGSIIGGWMKKDKARALTMLEDEERRVLAIENPVERAWQLKMLAGIVARSDPARGFEKMSLAIEEFNRADFSSELEKRETIQTAAGIATTIVEGGLGGLLDDRDFMWFGHADPERALKLAEQLSPREASSLAQLAVCRAMHSKLQSQKQPVTVKQVTR